MSRRPHSLIGLSPLLLPHRAHGHAGHARHFAAGLGNGQIATNQKGLRGAGNERNIHRRPDVSDAENDDRAVSIRIDHPRSRSSQQHERMNVLDDVEVINILQKGGDRRATSIATTYKLDTIVRDAGMDQPAADGPWQLSVIMLLGLVGVLVGFFLHFSTDPYSKHAHAYFRRKKKPHKSLTPHSYKKKTDEWSEDEEVTEDDSYRGDNEGPCGGSIAHKRSLPPSPVPPSPNDPTARLYYQLSGEAGFRQQEQRFRRSANKRSPNDNPSRPTSRPGPLSFQSPTRPRSTSITSASSSRKHESPSTKYSGSVSSQHSPYPSPPSMDRVGVGSGLEGLGGSNSSDMNFVADNVDYSTWSNPSGNTYPNASPKVLIKPMGTFTPSESFGSLTSKRKSSCDSSTDDSSLKEFLACGEVELDTPPLGGTESPGQMFVRSDSARSSTSTGQPNRLALSEQFAEMPTPRIDHRDKSRQIAAIQNVRVPLPPADDPRETSASSQHFTRRSAVAKEPSQHAPTRNHVRGIPIVPNLDESPSEDDCSFGAPRSIQIDELQLVRMESGELGPRWRTANEQYLPRETGGQSHHHPMFGSEKNAWYEPPDEKALERMQLERENMQKLQHAAESMDPQDDPRNSILHIRKDLTTSSDSASSLSSEISFKEVKLEDVIGGGGFGQVWAAKWQGTPVAVKVLTGTAQAETVPKAVLEEFIAEINIISGMRHPNICLFMGACLTPPNRAIVTELCENGSLWDALRSPLGSSYCVADGHSRSAWPLELYELAPPPPLYHNGQVSFSVPSEPPMPPAGAWPWALVKRVSAGAARGMCYLHSGKPPVLHRDLKSANILLDESYTAKLADFGLSRLKAVRSGMTGNCGTVQWMAPEVLMNEDYAEPADVFSYGIILWEMLTKECPYEGMTPIQCALSVLNENKRPEIPGWCPQRFCALIKDCVEKDPKARPTFPQILAALDAMP